VTLLKKCSKSVIMSFSVRKQGLVHNSPHTTHIAVHQMTVDIECGRHVAVSQKTLDVLGVTAALTQRVHRAMP